MIILVFFQAEDGIRDLVRSRGLGDVYKRQRKDLSSEKGPFYISRLDSSSEIGSIYISRLDLSPKKGPILGTCLLYTSDAADERSSVDLGGRRIIKKKKNEELGSSRL